MATGPARSARAAPRQAGHGPAWQNTHFYLHEIHTRHWQALALQSGVPGAFDHMVAQVLLVPQALQEARSLLPAGFPMAVFDAISRGMRAQAELFMGRLD